MPISVTMPRLGESVSEGTVTRWLKQVGEHVSTNEPLLEVSTDKVDTEIPSPVAGTLTAILVGEDATVAVGADLAVVGGAPGAGEAGGGDAQQAGAPDAEAALPAESAPEPDRPQPAPTPPPESAEQATRPTPEHPAPTHEQGLPEPTEVPQAYAAEPAPLPPQSPAPSAPPSAAAQGRAAPAAPAATGNEPNGVDASAYVTPLVRKLATQHGVDLASLRGTGVGGRIRKQDVLDAAQAAAEQTERAAAAQATAEQPPAVPPQTSSTGSDTAPAAVGGFSVSPKRGTTEKMSRLRKVIAQRMVESLQVSAQLTTVVEVDVTRISRLRDRAKRDFEAREGVKLSFLPFFALAAVEALKQHPSVNASVEGDQITYHGAEHLGVAVDTERGLLVPVIRDAGDLNIAGLSRKIADLAERTRGNKVTPDELGGGTFTLTNTGSRGALFDTPIINQPQVAILGTGAVVKRPVVVADRDGGETIAIRSMIYLALSYDHRIVDGADAARFLSTMRTRLEEGAFEASLGL